MRQAGTTLDIVRNALAEGYGPRDMSTIAVYLREGAN